MRMTHEDEQAFALFSGLFVLMGLN